MHSTPNVMARNLPFPPSLLFRNLASAASDRLLAPMDRGGFGPRGARNRLRIGGFVDSLVLIAEGLKPGERVVTSGAAYLRNGQLVVIVSDTPPSS